jgi:hypothetical protein
MGMESPDTRRKADDSYRAQSAGRRMCATGLVALTRANKMTRLPSSLSIALWLVGSILAVAIAVHLFAAPHELVYAALAFGVLAGVAEWFVCKGTKH